MFWEEPNNLAKEGEDYFFWITWRFFEIFVRGLERTFELASFLHFLCFFERRCGFQTNSIFVVGIHRPMR